MQKALGQRNYVTQSWLLARRAELRDRVRSVQADLSGEREPLPADSGEAAIALENDEVLKAIAAAALEELHHIDFALVRLNAGVFAICEKCGEEIDTQRMEALPHAIRCIDCAGEE
jgi:RNA polymerase-binding transcription factor DksA